MSGQTDYVLDTNAIISLLQGDPGAKQLVAGGRSVSMSIISGVEYLAWPGVTNHDLRRFEELLLVVQVIGLPLLDEEAVQRTIAIRQTEVLKIA